MDSSDDHSIFWAILTTSPPNAEIMVGQKKRNVCWWKKHHYLFDTLVKPIERSPSLMLVCEKYPLWLWLLLYFISNLCCTHQYRGIGHYFPLVLMNAVTTHGLMNITFSCLSISHCYSWMFHYFWLISHYYSLISYSCISHYYIPLLFITAHSC